MASRSGVTHRRSAYSTTMTATVTASIRRRSQPMRLDALSSVSSAMAAALARTMPMRRMLTSRCGHFGVSAGPRSQSNRARHVVAVMGRSAGILQDGPRQACVLTPAPAGDPSEGRGCLAERGGTRRCRRGRPLQRRGGGTGHVPPDTVLCQHRLIGEQGSAAPRTAWTQPRGCIERRAVPGLAGDVDGALAPEDLYTGPYQVPDTPERVRV